MYNSGTIKQIIDERIQYLLNSNQDLPDESSDAKVCPERFVLFVVDVTQMRTRKERKFNKSEVDTFPFFDLHRTDSYEWENYPPSGQVLEYTFCSCKITDARTYTLWHPCGYFEASATGLMGLSLQGSRQVPIQWLANESAGLAKKLMDLLKTHNYMIYAALLNCNGKTLDNGETANSDREIFGPVSNYTKIEKAINSHWDDQGLQIATP